MADDVFINPYTFVPLPKNGAVRSDPEQCADPVFSGEIKCTLITKMQIAVPDELKNPCDSDSEEKRTEPKEYDFFSYTIDGKRIAVIPGSGIRGVIRSVFETLTDSCMRLNDSNDDYFHTRLNKTFPGIIEFKNGGYILYKAKRLRDTEDLGYSGKYHTGDKIKGIGSRPGKNNAPDIVVWEGGSINGVYLCVNCFKGKDNSSHPSVFVREEILEKALDKCYIDRLKVNVEMYEGEYKEKYNDAIENMEKHGGQLPVWYYYDAQNGHYYFAPSQYSRAVFVKQPKDFVEEAKIERCGKEEKICEACALFGFIGENKQEDKRKDSRASRVRFTDAECVTPDPFDGSYILPILSNPRLSSFEFYLDGGTDENRLPRTAFGADTKGVTLRGRKFYWHDPKAHISSDNATAMAHPPMAVKTELVKAGVEFKFSVFFDKITDEQLKKLVFALNLGNNDSSRCHKIGHGKPIGLGSVKIKVDEIHKRSFEDGVYSVVDVTEEIVAEAKEKLFRQSRELQAFLQRVLDFNMFKNGTVDYPRTVPKDNDGDDIFKWFADNRGSLRSEGYIKVKQLLPKITDNTQTLKRIIPKNNGQGSDKKYRGK